LCLKLAEWMASSSIVGGGKLHSTDPDLHIWCVQLTMKEVVSHSAEKMLELILDEFQQINEIQHDQGLHEKGCEDHLTVLISTEFAKS